VNTIATSLDAPSGRRRDALRVSTAASGPKGINAIAAVLGIIRTPPASTSTRWWATAEWNTASPT